VHNTDMVLIAKKRYCQIDRQRRAILARFALLNLTVQRAFAILVPQRPIWPSNSPISSQPSLIAFFSSSALTAVPQPGWHRRPTWDVTSLPQHGIELLEQSLDRPSRVSFSRNSQIVPASGTRSSNPSPRNRINDSRSLMRNSARSSEDCSSPG